MRLFSALSVPEEATHTLAQFRGGLSDAKWVEPSDFHVTLAFFGEVGGPVADELADELAGIVAAPIDVRVSGLGVFGADRPHAVVALVERTPPLLQLESEHRAIMRRLDVGDRVRKYTPHVTLGRLRRTGAGDVAEWLSRQPVFRPTGWRADGFALFSSRTSRGGGPYVAEMAFPLAPGQAGVRTNSTMTS